MEKIKYYKWAIVALAISLALAAGWDIGNTMMIGYWKDKYYEIEDNIVKIDLHIIVAYSVNIKACSDNVIEAVKYKVEELTGLPVSEINIFVEGVRVID